MFYCHKLFQNLSTTTFMYIKYEYMKLRVTLFNLLFLNVNFSIYIF